MKVFKNSIIYAFVLLIQGVLSFLLVTLYTAFLSPKEYGTIGVVNALVNFLVIIYSSLLLGATRLYFDNTKYKRSVSNLNGMLLVVFAVSLIITILAFFFREIFNFPFFRQITFYPYILIGLITSIFYSFYISYLSILQAKQQSKKYGIIHSSFIILNALLSISFLIFFHLKVIGIMLAFLISSIIMSILISIEIIVQRNISLQRKAILPSFKLALMLVPHSLSGWSVVWLNKLLINNLTTTSAVGIYDVGAYFGSMVDIVRVPISQAYVPWFFEKMKKNEGKKIIRFIKDGTYTLSFIALLLSLFAREVVYVVAREYRDAWRVIPFMSFSFVFYGLYYFYINTFYYNKAYTKYIPLFVLFMIGLLSVFNIILTPLYGIIGSSIATFIAMITVSFSVWSLSRKILPVNIHGFRAFSIAAFFFLVSLFIFLNNFFDSKIFFILRLLIVLPISFFLYSHFKHQIFNILKNITVRYASYS